ncbi:MAG: PH domain-containing protein [Actinomycetota bacterium]
MTQEFRSAFGRGFTIAIGAAAAATIVFVAATSGLLDALVTLPWAAAFVTVVWAVFWRPHIAVSDSGVRFVNVTRTIDIPWPAVTAVDTRFALTVDTPYGRYAAWAAPAPSAGTALRYSMRMRSAAKGATHPGQDPAERPITSSSTGDMAGSPSAEAATIVRTRWEQLRRQGHLDDPRLEYARLPMRWNWQIGATIAALIIVGWLGLLVG